MSGQGDEGRGTVVLDNVSLVLEALHHSVSIFFPACKTHG